MIKVAYAMKQIQDLKTTKATATTREKDDAIVVAALKRRASVDVESVFDLVNNKNSYSNAIPVLIDILTSNAVADPLILQGVVRSLTVKEARGTANDALFALYFTVPAEQDSLKWAIGNAIGFLLRPQDFEAAKELVLNRENATSRQGVVSALGKIKRPESQAILLSLLDDPDVSAHAVDGLKSLKAKEAKGRVEDLLKSHSSLVRRKANSFLKAASKW